MRRLQWQERQHTSRCPCVSRSDGIEKWYRNSLWRGRQEPELQTALMVERIAFRHFIVSTNRIGNKNGCVWEGHRESDVRPLKTACVAIAAVAATTNEQIGRVTPALMASSAKRFLARKANRSLFLAVFVKIENCSRANVMVSLRCMRTIWGLRSLNRS